VTRLLVEAAHAKVNLTLHVAGVREDGYHDIDSLVAFAEVGDRLTLAPGRALGLTLRGPTAAATGEAADNLVLKAAQELAARIDGLKLGHFRLDKRLPVAAGLGGGSADAAAALRLLARANRLPVGDRRVMAAARATGADVPVCLATRARWMRATGEKLGRPLDLPRLPSVLAHPGVALPTTSVFAEFDRRSTGHHQALPAPRRRAPPSVSALVAMLAEGGNDLEPAAIKLQPVIAEVLAHLRGWPGCALARMSGSGATCFGLFASARAAAEAARALRRRRPRWWVQASVLK
jgi:4-diphosphocytidyl-2-C-methyl-D-erythritol kinase